MNNFTLLHKLRHTAARSYFCESKHFVSFDLPPYFSFDEILISASAILNRKTLADICVPQDNGRPNYPANFPDVNYVVLSNKDGSFAWRPLEIIHPVLYVDLVNLVTAKDAWGEVGKFFNKREESCVECISLPLRSNTRESNRATSVSNWWDKIEQESLRKALDFRFMFQTDISNCYPSIYTHSLEWAFADGGRGQVKEKRANNEDTSNIGTKIDQKLQNMNRGQTIGIPQGSALMDFVAEIVLGATDLELTTRIEEARIKTSEFKVLRYRDDYRIFSNEYHTGHKIMKILSDVLYAWNMKMNASKTKETSDLVTSSIKAEKLEEIYTGARRYSFQKQAMRLYILSKKYPNAGLIAKYLTDFYDSLDTYEEKLEKEDVEREFDYEVVIAIITMIAYYSPRYIPQVAAIVTRIIGFSAVIDRNGIIERIISKFDDVPNTEFIDVWLQRITDAHDMRKRSFSSKITEVALDIADNSSLWNSGWLNKDDRKTIDMISISTLRTDIAEGSFSPIVPREEFELYRVDYD